MLDLGVLAFGGVDVGVVDLGGVEVGVVDFGGVPLGLVNLGGVPSFGMVNFGFLELGLLDRLPHREGHLLLQRERVLLDCRELGLLGLYGFCGRAHASKLNPPICESTACQKLASSLAASLSGSNCQSGKLGIC